MVGSSPTSLYSAYFGALDLEKAAVLCFPQGLPGFETEHRFAAIQIPGQAPLIYLQSLSTAELCWLTFPVKAIQPSFQLRIGPEDREAIGLPLDALNPDDLLTLAIVAVEPDGGPTANLAAPLVVNLLNLRAVQALQPDPALSYRYPLAAVPSC